LFSIKIRFPNFGLEYFPTVAINGAGQYGCSNYSFENGFKMI